MVKTFDEFYNCLTVLIDKWLCCFFAGGSAGSRIVLSFGSEESCRPGTEITYQNGENTELEGEISLFVKSSWRLDGLSEPVTSSDEDSESIARALAVLIGKRVKNVEVFRPAWDMCVSFTDDLQLRVFCDRIAGDVNFDYNWHLRFANSLIAAGPGYHFQVEHKEGSISNG